MKKELILAVLLTSVSALGFSQTAFTVRNAATWIEAVNGIRNGSNDQEYTITVTGTVSVPATPSGENTFGPITGITITIAGSGALSPSNNGNLLVIGEEQTVVARDVTLRGRSDNGSYSVVTISSGGIFRMEGKASVTGNKTSGNVSGVFVNKQGTFTMQDSASVSGNTSSGRGASGGEVYINGGTFTMKDKASVSGNTKN